MSTEREFRLRLAEPGADQVDGNVAVEVHGTIGPDGFISGLSTYGGQRIDPTKGTADSMPWTIRVGETQAGEEFTRYLADAAGRPHALYRIGDVSHRPYGSADPWSVRATARLTTVHEIGGPGEWKLTFQDERVVERRARAFSGAEASDPTDVSNVDILHGASTTALYPMGLTEPYAGITEVVGPGDPNQRVVYRVGAVDGNAVRLRAVREENFVIPARATRLKLNEGVKQWIKDDVKPDVSPEKPRTTSEMQSATEGDFKHLVANVDGVDREIMLGRLVSILNDDIIVNPDLSVGTTFENGRVSIPNLHLYWPTNQPSVGDRFDVFFHAPTAPSGTVVPKHIGGTGTHPFQLAKDLLLAAGVRIDAAAFDALIGRTYPDVCFRITGAESLATWLEQNIFHPFAAVPMIDRQGRVSPRSTALPTADTLPDPTVLPLLDETNLREVPDWDHPSTEVVTELNYMWESNTDLAISLLEEEGAEDVRVPGDAAADLVDPVEETVRRSHEAPSAAFGPISEEVSFRGLHETGPAERAADYQSRQVFDRFGDGPIRTEVMPDESQEDLLPGDFVRLEVPTYPNMATSSRGGSRILQIVESQETVTGPEAQVLDAGDELQPLPAPDVSCTTDGNALDLTISNVPAGADGYLLRIAESDTEPPDDSTLWEPAGADPRTRIGGLKPNTTYQVQVRARARNRIGSVWSAATQCTTGGVDAITGASADVVGSCEVELSFTPGDQLLETEVLVDGVLQVLLDAGTDTVVLTDANAGIQSNTQHTVTFRHRAGRQSLPSTDDQVTFTTQSGAEKGPAVSGIQVSVGERQ